MPILVGWDNFPITEADVFSLICGQKRLPFNPGSEFRYSSGDYFLLGIIVKRLSGYSLHDFARRRIFEPLAMKGTFFDDHPTKGVEQRAVGHHKPDGDDWRLMRVHGGLVGGGGLNSCVEDLVAWNRNLTDNKLAKGKYLDELLRDGSLLDNRYCLDVDAYVKEMNPDAGPELTSRPISWIVAKTIYRWRVGTKLGDDTVPRRRLDVHLSEQLQRDRSLDDECTDGGPAARLAPRAPSQQAVPAIRKRPADRSIERSRLARKSRRVSRQEHRPNLDDRHEGWIALRDRPHLEEPLAPAPRRNAL